MEIAQVQPPRLLQFHVQYQRLAFFIYIKRGGLTYTVAINVSADRFDSFLFVSFQSDRMISY